MSNSSSSETIYPAFTSDFNGDGNISATDTNIFTSWVHAKALFGNPSKANVQTIYNSFSAAGIYLPSTVRAIPVNEACDYDENNVMDETETQVHLSYIQARAFFGSNVGINRVQQVFNTFVTSGRFAPTTILRLPSTIIPWSSSSSSSSKSSLGISSRSSLSSSSSPSTASSFSTSSSSSSVSSSSNSSGSSFSTSSSLSTGDFPEGYCFNVTSFNGFTPPRAQDLSSYPLVNGFNGSWLRHGSLNNRPAYRNPNGTYLMYWNPDFAGGTWVIGDNDEQLIGVANQSGYRPLQSWTWICIVDGVPVWYMMSYEEICNSSSSSSWVFQSSSSSSRSSSSSQSSISSSSTHAKSSSSISSPSSSSQSSSQSSISSRSSISSPSSVSSQSFTSQSSQSSDSSTESSVSSISSSLSSQSSQSSHSSSSTQSSASSGSSASSQSSQSSSSISSPSSSQSSSLSSQSSASSSSSTKVQTTSSSGNDMQITATLYNDSSVLIDTFTSDVINATEDGLAHLFTFTDATYANQFLGSIAFSSTHPIPSCNVTGITVTTETVAQAQNQVSFSYFEENGRWLAAIFNLGVKIIGIEVTLCAESRSSSSQTAT